MGCQYFVEKKVSKRSRAPVARVIDREESDLVVRIRKLCKENGISMRRLERDNDFGNGLVSKWSHSSPSVAYLQKVANYFGVSINYLLGQKEVAKFGDKYEFPQNIVAESREDAYSVDEELVRMKAMHQKLDIQHMLKYLVKVTNDGSKELLYKGRSLTKSEIKELKVILKQTAEASKVFEKAAKK